MNKHIALVLGTIFSVTILFVPFTGAFASSDTSVALPQFVFSLMFTSVTTPTFVDVTNYNAATGTTSSGSSVSLANSVGSYSHINRTGIPVAQNLICVKFTFYDPTPRLLDDVSIEPYVNGYPANVYGSYTFNNYDNQIDYYMFFYIGNDSLRVKDGAGNDITPWGIRITTNAVRDYSWSYSRSSTTFYYYNYIAQSQIDPGQASEIALDIINVLQLSQLSENLGMINTQLDTGNISSMMQSMLTYLAQIPDIIQYIDQLETTDANILSAIDTFYNYYISLFSNYTFIHNSNNNYRLYLYRNDTWTQKDNSSSAYYQVQNTEYMFISQYYANLLSYNDYFVYKIKFPSNNTCESFNCYYRYASTPSNFIGYPAYSYYSNYALYIYIPYIDTNASSWISFTIQPNSTASFRFYISEYDYYILSYNISWYRRIELYLRQLLGSNNTVPTEIQQTTDEINQNATAVNDFQSSTQQSLDQDLQNVPVADYQIQATTGTQYMKAYSEALFNASNGFRIWYMLPLILFVIGMLIRWGVKK